MMYTDKLVVCLKVGGKILREFNDEVYVPFGTEYSIFVKNLNSVRASVMLEIDGKPVFADGGSLIVDANSSVEVERFVTNNSRGNRFKFIERTAKIEQHKGVGAEDGLIRVAFQYERPQRITPRPNILRSMGMGKDVSTPPMKGRDFLNANSVDFADGQPRGINCSALMSNVTMDSCVVGTASPGVSVYERDTSATPKNEVGITVAGSISSQQFQEVAAFPLEAQVHVLVLKILGDIGQNVKVDKPITVKTKVECTTCGTKSKATAKFCPECSASLELVA